MQCSFYGQYSAVETPMTLRAKCPTCYAIRTLQKRNGGVYYYPPHTSPEGTSNVKEYLVYSYTSERFEKK